MRRQSSRLTGLIPVILLTVPLLVPATPVAADVDPEVPLEARGPIRVTGNDELRERFPGKGTPEDPVRIAAYRIDALHAPAIRLESTTLHVVIENVAVEGARKHDCVVLRDVAHVTVRHVRLEGCSSGVFLQGVQGARVENATVGGSLRGIEVVGVDAGLTAVDNVLAGNDQNLHLRGSTGNVFRRNQLSFSGDQYGVYVQDKGSRDNDLDPSNRVNGQPLPWYVNRRDLRLTDVGAVDARATNVAQVLLYRVENVTVDGVTARHGRDGVLVQESRRVTLTGVVAELNGESGVRVVDSRHVALRDAAVAGNGRDGLRVEESFAVTVNDLAALENDGVGVRATGSADVRVDGLHVEATGRTGVQFVDVARPVVQSGRLGPVTTGLDLHRVHNGTFTDLEFTPAGEGVRLRESTHNAFRETRIHREGDAFGFRLRDASSRANDVDASNRVNGEPVVWLWRVHGTDGNTIALSGLEATEPRALNVAQMLVHDSHNLTLDAPVARGGHADGLLLSQVADVRVHDANLTENRGAGLRVEHGERIRLVDVAAGANDAGLRILDSADVGVTGGHVWNARTRGVDAARVAGLTVDNVTVHGERAGLRFADVTALTAADVHVTAGRDGVHVAGSPDADLARWTVSAGGTGVHLTQSPGARVGALDVDAGGTGVRVTRSPNLVVSEVDVDAGSAGVAVSASPRAAVLASAVRADGVGVQVRGSDNALVNGTRVTGARVGVDVTDSDHGRFTHNTLHGNDAGARFAKAQENAFAYNEIVKTASQVGLHVEASAYANRFNGTNLVMGEPVRWYWNVTDARLENLVSVVPNVTNVGQIVLHDVQNVTLVEPRAENGTRGLVLDHVAGVNVTGARITATPEAGVHVRAGSAWVNVTASHVTGGRTGVLVERSAHVIMNGTRVTHATLAGVGVHHNRDVHVHNVTVLDAPTGFEVTHTEDAHVAGVHASDVNTGVRLRSTQDARVENATLHVREAGVELAKSGTAALHATDVWKPDDAFGLVFRDAASYPAQVYNESPEGARENRVNGEPVLWLHGLHGEQENPVRVENLTATVPNVTNVAQIMVYRSSDVHLVNATAVDGVTGVYVLESEAVNVTDATLARNRDAGLRADAKSRWLEVHGGTFQENAVGLAVDAGGAAVRVTGTHVTGGDIGLRLHRPGTGTRLAGLWVANVTGAGVHVTATDGSGVLAASRVENASVGVHLDDVHQFRLDENAFRYNDQGVHFRKSTLNRLDDNGFLKRDDQFALHFADEASYNNRVPVSNLVHGAGPLHWYTHLEGTPEAPVRLAGLTDGAPNLTNVAQVLLRKVTHVDVEAPRILHGGTGAGLLVLESTNVRVTNATAHGHAREAVRLVQVDASHVTGGRFHGGTHGVRLQESAGNRVHHVRAVNASVAAVSLEGPGSRDNRVWAVDAEGSRQSVRLAGLRDARNLIVDAGADKRVTYGDPVSFDDALTRSHSVAKPVTEYRWGFGDGTPERVTDRNPAPVTHAYPGVGRYEARVTAVVDGRAYEDRVPVTVLPELPTTPLNLTVNATTGVARLAWEPPESLGGAPGVTYRVVRANASGDIEAATGLPAPVFVDAGVHVGETYRYAVAAENAAGAGHRTPWTEVRVVNVPDAPVNFTLATLDNGSIELQWALPEEDGGEPVRALRVLRQDGGDAAYRPLVDLPPDAVAYVDAHPPHVPWWRYRVAAVNDVGEGVPTGAQTATAPGVPLMPENLTAYAWDGRVRLTWDAPANDSPARTHRVYRLDPVNHTPVLVADNVTDARFVDAHPPRETLLRYRVAAVNVRGDEGETAETASLVVPRAPEAPRNLTLRGSPDGFRATWRVPPNATAPVAGWLVTLEADGEPPRTWRVPASARSWETGNATPAVPHNLTLRAENAGGLGAPAHAGPAISGPLPDAPRNLTGEVDGDTVHLAWEAPPETVLPVLRYHVWWRANGSAPQAVATVNATHLNLTHHPGPGEHAYAVIAENAMGNGTAAGPWNGTVPPPGDRPAPEPVSVRRVTPVGAGGGAEPAGDAAVPTPAWFAVVAGLLGARARRRR